MISTVTEMLDNFIQKQMTIKNSVYTDLKEEVKEYEELNSNLLQNKLSYDST